MSNGSIINVPKTAELVARRLRRQIVSGELQEGDLLPSEATLTTVFGISRPTLREAFRVLESEQLITVRRGAHGGARVHVPHPDVAARFAGLVLEHQATTLADIYAARVFIEAPCAALAARRRREADVERLWRSVRDGESVLDNRRSLIRQHTEFHALVVELAQNRTVSLMSSMLRHIIDTANYRRVDPDTTGPIMDRAFDSGVRAHRTLVAYIEAGDADRAEQLWRRHLEEANEFLLQMPGTATIVDLLE